MALSVESSGKVKVGMQTVMTFTVKPSLPEQIKDLYVVAGNLYWSWHYETWRGTKDFFTSFRRLAKNWKRR
jgi:hypothetical protein